MYQKIKKIAVSAALLQIAALHCFSQAAPTKVEEIAVISFYQDKQIEVQMGADPDFSGTAGRVKVELNRSNRATISAEFKALMSPLDIGGQYSAYVLWAVLGDGSVERLGSPKINGKNPRSNGEVKTDKSLTSFGLLLTAEPHPFVQQPSRTVVLRSASRALGKNAGLATSEEVLVALSDRDYSRQLEKPGKLDKKARQALEARRAKPLAIYGAEYACELAKEAQAALYVPAKYNEAVAKRDELRDMWNRKGKAEEIDKLANDITILAAAAEADALDIKQGRKAENEKKRREDDISEQKQRIDDADKEIKRLNEALATAESQRDGFMRDFQDKNAQYNIAIERQKEEKSRAEKLQREKDDLVKKVADVEAKMHQMNIIRNWVADKTEWKRFLSGFGEVVQREEDLVLTFPEKIWMQPDSFMLNADLVDLVPLIQRIAAADYLGLTINSEALALPEDENTAITLAEERSKRLKADFIKFGIAAERINSETIVGKPIARTKKAAPLLNRIRITLKLIG